MKISKLFYLLLIGLAIHACSDDDTDLPGGNTPEDIDNYFPLVAGNTWNYENVVMSPAQDDIVSNETLSVVGSTMGDFDLETDNPMNAGPVTSALDQGVLRKSGSQLIFTGALGFAVEGFPNLEIALNDAAIYDVDASSGTILYADSGSSEETIENVPLTINYEIETVMGANINSYSVNGMTYNDVITSQIIIRLEIRAAGIFTVLPEQDVIVIDNYFALDIGMVSSETEVEFDFTEVGQLPLPIEDFMLSSTQSLESYTVELD